MMPSDAAIPAAPLLQRSPSPWVWRSIVLVGLVLEGLLLAQAKLRRATATVDSTRAAAVAAERADSARLQAAADSGARLPRDRVLVVDSAAHATPLAIRHVTVHRRAVADRLDSAAALLRRAGSLADVEHARAQLALVVDPLSAAQVARRRALAAQLRASERTVTRRIAPPSTRTPR